VLCAFDLLRDSTARTCARPPTGRRAFPKRKSIFGARGRPGGDTHKFGVHGVSDYALGIKDSTNACPRSVRRAATGFQ
jgi:hypothetical protein